MFIEDSPHIQIQKPGYSTPEISITQDEFLLEEPFQTIFGSSLWGAWANIPLKLEFHSNTNHPRGMVRGNILTLYSELPKSEQVSVAIHEYAHIFHIAHIDASDTALIDEFLEISWLTSQTKKPGAQLKDFVSGYALSNAYEEFAESTYFFLLYSEEFQKKAQRSPLLAQKYQILNRIYPRVKQITQLNHEKIPDYFWDSTRLPVRLDVLIAHFSQ